MGHRSGIPPHFYVDVGFKMSVSLNFRGQAGTIVNLGKSVKQAQNITGLASVIADERYGFFCVSACGSTSCMDFCQVYHAHNRH